MKQIFRDDGLPIIIDNNLQKSNGKYINRFNSNQIEKEGLFIPDMNYSLAYKFLLIFHQIKFKIFNL